MSPRRPMIHSICSILLSSCLRLMMSRCRAMMLGHRQVITCTSRLGLLGRIARRRTTPIMIAHMIARRPTIAPMIRLRSTIGVEAMMPEGPALACQTLAGRTLAVWTVATDFCLRTLVCRRRRLHVVKLGLPFRYWQALHHMHERTDYPHA